VQVDAIGGTRGAGYKILPNPIKSGIMIKFEWHIGASSVCQIKVNASSPFSFIKIHQVG